MIPKMESFLRAALAEVKTSPGIFVEVIDELVRFNNMTIEDQERFLNETLTRWLLTQKRGRKLPKKGKKKARKTPKSPRAAINQLLKE